MPSAAPSLDGFDQTTFTDGDAHWPLYRAGAGPAVVVLHEVPGITPPVAAFALRVAGAGFSVYMPSLFGTPGKPFTVGYDIAQLARACISREVYVLSRRGSSPLAKRMRALCRHAHAEQGGPGVGVIGMCLTGNFALSMMVDPSVMAPVLSQPSLPFGFTRRHHEALHLDHDELLVVRERTAEGVSVLGLRFTHDVLCPGARFERLRAELGDGFEGIEINSGPGNPHGLPRTAHSVLARDLVDEVGHPTRAALDRVLGFLDERLRET